MTGTHLATALSQTLPDGRVVVDPDVLVGFSRDGAAFATAGAPLAMVRAQSVDDVVSTLWFATAHRVPVVPRGAGTGLAGGANAVDDRTTVRAVERLTRMGLDEDHRRAAAPAVRRRRRRRRG